MPWDSGHLPPGNNTSENTVQRKHPHIIACQATPKKATQVQSTRAQYIIRLAPKSYKVNLTRYSQTLQVAPTKIKQRPKVIVTFA